MSMYTVSLLKYDLSLTAKICGEDGQVDPNCFVMAQSIVFNAMEQEWVHVKPMAYQEGVDKARQMWMPCRNQEQQHLLAAEPREQASPRGLGLICSGLFPRLLRWSRADFSAAPSLAQAWFGSNSHLSSQTCLHAHALTFSDNLKDIQYVVWRRESFDCQSVNISVHIGI